MKTPTEAIVKAMEHADDMVEVVIVYKLKKNSDGKDGIGWISTIETTDGKIGILEEAKLVVFGKAYGLDVK
jgi:hypothetical protein